MTPPADGALGRQSPNDGQANVLNAEQIFSVRDGEVMWRGHWLPTQNAVNLLANLQGQSWAEVLVEQLSEAIATVSEQEIEHA